jgi:ubiquitin-conjugating enzyme (huntingtin interacting protein 2)
MPVQVLTLKSTLISLQSLLCEPVPDDPQDAEGDSLTGSRQIPTDRVGAVAKHYLADRASFTATAKHWAQAYAQAPASKSKAMSGKVATDAEMAGLSETNVTAFVDMGFPRDKVVCPP